VKANNPWRRLPDEPPFVLAEDKDAVLAFNDEARQKGHPHLLNLQIIPVPFVEQWTLRSSCSGTSQEQGTSTRTITRSGQRTPTECARICFTKTRILNSFLWTQARIPFRPTNNGGPIS
jgi:hypothetical protein